MTERQRVVAAMTLLQSFIGHLYVLPLIKLELTVHDVDSRVTTAILTHTTTVEFIAGIFCFHTIYLELATCTYPRQNGEYNDYTWSHYFFLIILAGQRLVLLPRIFVIGWLVGLGQKFLDNFGSRVCIICFPALSFYWLRFIRVSAFEVLIRNFYRSPRLANVAYYRFVGN